MYKITSPCNDDQEPAPFFIEEALPPSMKAVKHQKPSGRSRLMRKISLVKFFTPDVFFNLFLQF
jgi:hypothetical protein